MRASCAIGAIAALAAGFVMIPTAQADVTFTEISIGSIKNIGGGDIEYTGDYAAFVSSGLDTTHTLVDIDLAGIVALLGYNALGGVRFEDVGSNQYGATSPGADLDYIGFSNLLNGTSFALTYSGPNQTHQEESAAALMQRIENLDAASGDQDSTVMHFVSLGDQGTLSTVFDTLQPASADSPLADGSSSFTSLHVSEHGFSEEFEVIVFATNVPAPGVLTLFALNLLRRRRARLQ